MKVFLIGLPGCGKSTLGREVAQTLDRHFVDLDTEIVKREGQSVAKLFETVGEKRFRFIEKHCLEEWCQKDGDFIMATGGGTPCFFSNTDTINRSGISIFLDTSADEIAKRMMKTELAKRPLFQGESIRTVGVRVAEMRKQRLSFYEKAKIKLQNDQISATVIVSEILNLER